jgi:hypothetical protein
LNPALTLLDGELAVARLEEAEAEPGWALPGAGIVAVIRAPGETTVICDAAAVPGEVRASGPWRALVVAGPLDHALTGVLAAIAAPLAAATVPIFALSTYDTDYVLVPSERTGDALDALRDAGLDVGGGP